MLGQANDLPGTVVYAVTMEPTKSLAELHAPLFASNGLPKPVQFVVQVTNKDLIRAFEGAPAPFDVVDMDCQGCECKMHQDPDLMRLWQEKAKVAHIEIHCHPVHAERMRQAFEHMGWRTERNVPNVNELLSDCDPFVAKRDFELLPDKCLVDTPYGPIYHRAGYLLMVNRRFHPEQWSTVPAWKYGN